MPDLESAVHWRQWSVAVILALLLSVFSLVRFNLVSFSLTAGLGCAVLVPALGWNLYALRRARAGRETGLSGGIADGLLLLGLVLVSFGTFF